jgi:tetratricopeptide (TPR) repeat protein
MNTRIVVIALIATLSGAFAQLSGEAQRWYTEAQRLQTQAIQTYPKASIDLPLWSQAAEAAEKAVAAAPNEPQPLRLRAVIYTQVGFWARAELSWNAYFAAAGDSDDAARNLMSEVQVNLGYSAYRLEDGAAAEQYFAQALEFNPDNPQALSWRARTLLERGDANAAVPLLERAVSLNPQDRVARYSLLVARKSAAFGRQATQAFFLGYAAYNQGQRQEALQAFREATVGAPNFLEAQRMRGRTALELGLGEEAALAYEIVVKLEGATPENTFQLGVAREVAQFGAEASRAYRSGYELYTRGDKSGAAQAFVTAVTANQQFQKAWAWLGRVRFEMGDFKGAVEAYQRAVQLDPNDRVSAYNLRQAQAKLAGR